MKTRRVFYMAGPGDVIGTFRHWRSGQDDPRQLAIAYSYQFYDLCEANGYRAYVLSYCNERATHRDGLFSLEHRPVPFRSRGGALFHLGWYLFSLYAAIRAISSRADVAVLMTGTHLTPYWLLKLAGIRVVMTQHCVLWPQRVGRRGAWKVVHRLDRPFFSRECDSILSISSDVTDQIQELTSGRAPDAVEFRPTYRRDALSAANPPPIEDEFRVLFVGRVERDKGVMELLGAASALRDSNPAIRFDVAGDGGALPELRSRIAAERLDEHVITHGYCERPRLNELYERSHAVIAPTQDGMIEGLNKVVVESVLAGRPIITSSVCPALRLVRDAAVEAPTNDAAGYAAAIRRLSGDHTFYADRVAACDALRDPFLTPDCGWAAAVANAVSPTARYSPAIT